MEIKFFPSRGSNPVRWTQSPTLYRVAIKASLYRKAVQVYHMIYLYPVTLNVTGEKMEIIFFPSRGSNPVRWTQSPILYRVAIKASLYRKAVQVSYIPIPGDRWTVDTND